MAMKRWWTEPFAPGKLCPAYPEPGEVVAYFRSQRGLSRWQIAQSLNITENMLYRMEHYSYCLNKVPVLCHLQRLLDIPPALLGLSNPCLVNVPGSVIKEYRSLKNWTQFDLADALNVSRTIVRRMENKSLHINSLSRRRALQILLSIPPAMLGLDDRFAAPRFTQALAPTYPALNLADVHAAQSKLWTGYYAGHSQDGINQVRMLISQIDEALPFASESELPSWLEAQSLSYQWLANMLRDASPASSVLYFSSKAVGLSREAGNPDLLSVALLRQMETTYVLHEEEKAVDLARAYSQFSSPDPVVNASRAIALARVLSLAACDQADRSQVLSLLDQSNNGYGNKYGLVCDYQVYLLFRGESLLNLSSNALDRSALLRQSSRLLDQIELSSVTIRHLLRIKLAQSQIALLCREYDLSSVLALEAWDLSRQVHSVSFISQFVDIYHSLQKSSYASSPYVARLGLLLFESGML